MKTATNPQENERNEKIYEGEIVKESFLAWLRYFFDWLTLGSKREEGAEKEVFRVISPESFFLKDYIDVSLNVLPKVGQMIGIKTGKKSYTVIRRVGFVEEYERVLKKEGLTHASPVIAEEILLEKYPYLLLPSNPLFHSGRMLEVVDSGIG